MDAKRRRKEVYGEKWEKKKEKKNKVEEFQLANPASLGSLANKNMLKYFEYINSCKVCNRCIPIHTINGLIQKKEIHVYSTF